MMLRLGLRLCTLHFALNLPAGFLLVSTYRIPRGKVEEGTSFLVSLPWPALPSNSVWIQPPVFYDISSSFLGHSQGNQEHAVCGFSLRRLRTSPPSSKLLASGIPTSFLCPLIQWRQLLPTVINLHFMFFLFK